MKGISKFMSRTPHLLTSKAGLSKKSLDPEFDEYERKFTAMEAAVAELLKDSQIFDDAVVTLLGSGAKFAEVFANIFHPLQGEYNLIGSHPESEKTIKNVDNYHVTMNELKDTLSPELELINTRVIAPAKEFQTIVKAIRKAITKREHKLVDYDRFNNSLTKLREKKEKSLSDEKNLFKMEQDFELATQEYEQINTNMKHELPQFLVMATQFIDPLFHSFYYMQLNIYYLMMEKIQGFATEIKLRPATSGNEILGDYENERTEAWQQIDALKITKRVASTAKMMADARANSGSDTASTVSRSTTFKKAPPPPPPGAAGGSFKKKPPPPPPSSSSSLAMKKKPPPPPGAAVTAPPPPYDPGSGEAAQAALAQVSIATKRAPPAPPAPKPKPKPPVVQPVYVIALYDFSPQAPGDLEFKTGDQIEVVSRTESAEDWWTGRLDGREGVFPGNYVKDA